MTIYVVLRGDGSLKLKARRAMCFLTERGAQRFASHPGDSVMLVKVDLNQKPLFIRGVKVIED